METSFSCLGSTAYFSSDERKWINRIRRLKEKHPLEVSILAEPEYNDGCIYASFPARALHIFLTESRPLTDEQRESAIANFSKRRKADDEDDDGDEDDVEDDEED